jgi:plasmid segregation protein ParM
MPSLAPCLSGPVHDLPAATQHDGVLLELDGVGYFVGKSSPHLVDGRGGLRAATTDYSETPSYKALLLGALYYIAKKKGATGSLTIQQLTLGLPLSTVFTHATRLKKMAQGEHTLPCPSGKGTIMVYVKNVVVVAQPQGALTSLARKLGKSITKERVLVLDMGGGTFDWFVADGMRPNYLLSGAAPMGVLACASAICDKLDPNYKSDTAVMAKVDKALRERSPSVRITGQDLDMAALWPVAENVLKSAIDQMMKKVGSLAGMDHILLTGGGAELLFRCVPSTLRRYESIITVDSDPLYSNVRGFHLIAQMFAEAASAS